ncbi:unnamed protein product [Pleuronectes platessa]|uniref:Uncharacterized protein n=1 Tax=Pleuronectes platessa TaxID=8262 RepID=A0A9N7YEQ4_PLEPL|nr:unnamed protein product [Pleuronectes platessa]
MARNANLDWREEEDPEEARGAQGSGGRCGGRSGAEYRGAGGGTMADQGRSMGAHQVKGPEAGPGRSTLAQVDGPEAGQGRSTGAQDAAVQNHVGLFTSAPDMGQEPE